MMTRYGYLMQLKNPHEAVIPSVWLDWITIIRMRAAHFEEMKNVLAKSAKDVATQFGLVWAGNSTDTVNDIISKSWEEIRDKKHVSSNWKKNVVLMISRLVSLEQEDVKRIAVSPPSESEAREKQKEKFYKDSYQKLVKYLLDATKILTNDNYENIFSGFIKHIIGFTVSSTEYKVENLDRYIKILYRRYHDLKTIDEVSKELRVQPGVINMGSQRFINDFKTYIIGNPTRHLRLFKKLEEFSDKALEVLDKTDLEARNLRLKKCRHLERNLISRPENYWEQVSEVCEEV